MERRIVLGKTQIEVCRLGLGGIPLQRVVEEQAIETVLHAVEKGVDFIDTSRAYTNSEHRIGKALKHSNRKVFIASKSQSKDADGLRVDLETSLTELQRDTIDIYQCHNVHTVHDYERVISPGGALEAMLKAKEEGLIRHIGITSHSLDLLDRVLDDGIFETIMVCFSLLENSACEKIIPKAIRKDVGIIAMKPFSGGVIENATLALKYVLMQPDILILAGVEHPDLFDENWAVFQNNYELDSSETDKIEAIRKKFDKIFCRRCDYCQPCTEDIPIQFVLGVRSLYRRRGKIILEKGWISEAIDKARNCSRCEECMSRCPYQLPIPDLIEENLKWVGETLKET
jgi:predicted aldo/keto reductase-like oxidoreductase